MIKKLTLFAALIIATLSFGQDNIEIEITITSDEDAVYHEMQKGQTLYQIAKFYYGSKKYAYKIYYYDSLKSNPNLNPDYLMKADKSLYASKNWIPGTILKIPAPMYTTDKKGRHLKGYLKENPFAVTKSIIIEEINIGSSDSKTEDPKSPVIETDKTAKTATVKPSPVLKEITIDEKPYPITISGKILDFNTRDITIELLDSKLKLLHQAKINTKERTYSFPSVILDQSYTIVAKNPNSMTQRIPINHLNVSDSYDISFPQSASKKINKGETAKITTSDNNAELTLPADIVKRLDGKEVQYPIEVKIAYLDPEKDLHLMPGIDMLAEVQTTKPGQETAQTELMPLMSQGAVLIEAKDAEGAELRVDREKAKKTGKDTKLRIRPKGNTENSEGWILDKQSKQLSWRKTSSNIYRESTANEKNIDEVLKSLPKGYLKEYAKLVAYKFAKPIKSKAKLLFDVTLKLKDKIDEKKILKELMPFLHLDLEHLQVQGEKQDRVRAKIFLGQGIKFAAEDFPELYDIYSDNEWYKQGTYQNFDFEINATPIKNFDYKPFQKNIKVKKIAEKLFWKNAVFVESVDLIPFNLDVPKKGVPIVFQLSEKKGEGKYIAILESQGDYGSFFAKRNLLSKSKAAQFKILAPEKSKLKLSIIRESKDTIIKNYATGISNNQFKWGENGKSSAVTTNNQPIQWQLLADLKF